MKWSDVKGRKVVSTSTADTVGKLHDLVVDTATQQVVGLVLKKTPGDGDTVAWSAITAFGQDAITVPGAEVIAAPEGQLKELQDKSRQLDGKRVLSQSGVELGEAKDLEFEADGTITSLITKTETIAGARLVATGSYATVVKNA